MKPTIGKVYLVGAGPGDPKLITLRGKELLARADTIIYDYLANPLLLTFAKETVEKIYVGKKGGTRSERHQDQINQEMIHAARAGKIVVRLKGGDPFIFGRGGEEAEALYDAEIPFEVIPGVTSAIAVPTYAGIPLTHRQMASSAVIVTGHEDPTKEENQINWKVLSTACDTLVVLMGMGNLHGIVSRLIQNGRDPQTPIALIQWGTYPHQKTAVGTLKNIERRAKSSGIKPPVVMVIGTVVTLRDQMNWFESRPLFGQKILVTRAKEQAHEFADLLSEQGAEVISFPTIKVVPPPNFTEMDRAILNIERYDTIIFTSANGVRAFWERLRYLGSDVRILKGISLCAIGPRTQEEIVRMGVRCDVIPSEFVAEGIIKALEKKGGFRGRRFLIPRAMEARELLPVEIRKRGGAVDLVPAYQTVLPDEREIDHALLNGPLDMLTFSSASTVKNFVTCVDKKRMKILKKSAVACIGPITAQAARACGFQVSVMPRAYTFPALTSAIIDFFNKKRKK